MGVDPEIACGIVGNIGQLWLDGQFVDLEIHVGDSLFNCNRFILCACSNFFKVLLKSEVKGEGEHPTTQVTIRGISPEIVQLVLKAVYQGENGLNTENMIEFWHAVHQLEIPFLASKCETFIDSHMTPENFVNIYQNALLLKSRNVIHAAHRFVAKNLECFKELDILLQQPVSYIEEIIGDDSLVRQSQNHVVEFILKWVNYELCASEAGPMCADSTAGDLSAQISEVTRNKHDSVEVIFQKPHATFGEDCKRNISGQSLDRKQSLGKLLKQIRFTDISQDSLEMLSDNNLVMGSKETRDIIKQAQEERSALTSSATTPATSTPAASIDTEETVVFAINDINCTIFAYSLDSGYIFKFLSTTYKISNISTYQNELLCHSMYSPPNPQPPSANLFSGTAIAYSSGKTLPCYSVYSQPNPQPPSENRLSMIEFPFSSRMSDFGCVPNKCVKVEDFYYTVKNNNHMCRKRTTYDDWYPLFSLPEHMPSCSLTVLKHSILYYNFARNILEQQKIYCFNTKSKKHWHMMSCDYTNCDFVTLIHNDHLYILCGNGVFVDVTNSVISPEKYFSLPTYSEISKNDLLWDLEFKIYGAVVHQDNLVVFGDLSSVLVSEIPECKIPGLKSIKFVHLYDLLTKCHPLVIPKNLLLNQV